MDILWFNGVFKYYNKQKGLYKFAEFLDIKNHRKGDELNL